MSRNICVMILAGAAGLSGWRSYGDADPGAAVPETGNAAAVEQLSQATENLYGRVAKSLVRIRAEQTPATMLTAAQRKEFNEWARGQIAQAQNESQTKAETKGENRATTQESSPRKEKEDGRKGGDGNPATMASASARPSTSVLLRRYVEQKIQETENKSQQGKWRQMLARLQQPLGEMVGVVIDQEGYAVVLGAWTRDGAPATFRVTEVDGTETTAKYVGAHAARGLAVVKLDTQGITPAGLSEGSPTPGQLLMCVTGNTGAIGWISAPGAIGRRARADRFAVFGAGGGANYLFDSQGRLAAVGFDRFALPVDVVRNDIKWIIENHKDVTPRQLGVKYSPVSPSLRKTMRVLANRPAVVVDDVAAGSLADRAGLKKSDIVISIDRRPIWQMPQIQWDIATQTEPVPIGIVRDDKEVTLQMPLD